MIPHGNPPPPKKKKKESVETAASDIKISMKEMTVETETKSQKIISEVHLLSQLLTSPFGRLN